MTSDTNPIRTPEQRFSNVVLHHAVHHDDLLVVCEMVGTLCDLGYDVDLVKNLLDQMIRGLQDGR